MYSLIPFEQRENQLLRMLDNFEKSFFNTMGPLSAAFRTDIKELEDKFVLEAELPGFDREEIQVDLDEGRLTIRAEHKEENEEKGDNYVRRERRYGTFVRSFDVAGIQEDAISAAYQNGVLTLELPKSAQVQKETRKIQIQ